MKVVYIAGKYRDDRGEYYVRQNILAAEEAALYVWKLGGVALCPHKNTSGFNGAYDLSDEVWLKGDLELIKRCDAIWMLPHWEDSQGARKEMLWADELDMPILRTISAVETFLANKA